MSTKSRIEWTEQTWNPTSGCTKISPGCKHCYAEVMASRLQAMGSSGYENGFKLALHPLRLSQPLQRKKSTTYFVNSMSDLFHEDIPDAFLDDVFSVIKRTPQHIYQILTKRAHRLPLYFATRDCPENVWLGVSVEDRAYGLPRIEHLRQVNSTVRFLSIEPLGPEVHVERSYRLFFGDQHIGECWIISPAGNEATSMARVVIHLNSAVFENQARTAMCKPGLWRAPGRYRLGLRKMHIFTSAAMPRTRPATYAKHRSGCSPARRSSQEQAEVYINGLADVRRSLCNARSVQAPSLSLIKRVG
jgi:hypothetical protein